MWLAIWVSECVDEWEEMYVSIGMNEWIGVYNCMNMCIVLCGCVGLWECVGEMWMKSFKCMNIKVQ